MYILAVMLSISTRTTSKNIDEIDICHQNSSNCFPSLCVVPVVNSSLTLIHRNPYQSYFYIIFFCRDYFGPNLIDQLEKRDCSRLFTVFDLV